MSTRLLTERTMRTKADVLRHFDDFAIGDRWSKLYDRDGDAVANYSFIVRRRRASELLESILSAGDRVLDVGCGPGVMTPFVLKQGADYCGLDLSEQMIEQAARRFGGESANGGSVRFAVGDVESIAYPDAHFDAAMALGVLEYLADPASAASELVRTTRPGGTILASVPISWCPDEVASRLFSPVVTSAARGAVRDISQLSK